MCLKFREQNETINIFSPGRLDCVIRRTTGRTVVGLQWRHADSLKRMLERRSLRLAPARCKPLVVTSVTNSIQFHSTELKRWGVQSRGRMKAIAILCSSYKAPVSSLHCTAYHQTKLYIWQGNRNTNSKYQYTTSTKETRPCHGSGG
jgi:hypothetical protein